MLRTLPGWRPAPGLDRVRATVRRHPWLLAATVGARLLAELSPMARPALVGWLVDLCAASDGRVAPAFVWGVLGIGAAGLLQAGSTQAYAECSARLGLATVQHLRMQLVSRWLAPGALPLSLGDILTRSSRDVDRLRSFVDRLYVRSVTLVARGVVPIIALFCLETRLAVVALAVLPIQQATLAIVGRRMQTASRSTSEAHAELLDGLERALRAAESPRGIEGAATEMTAHDLGERGAAVEAAELRTARLLAAIRALVLAGTATGLAATWWVGIAMLENGELTLGGLVSFTGYATLAYRPFRQLANAAKVYRSGLASLERIESVLDDAASLPRQARS